MNKTPKEKAEELINKYYAYQPILSKKECRLFALIAANEVCNTLDIFNKKYDFWNNVRIILLLNVVENNKGTQ